MVELREVVLYLFKLYRDDIRVLLRKDDFKLPTLTVDNMDLDHVVELVKDLVGISPVVVALDPVTSNGLTGYPAFISREDISKKDKVTVNDHQHNGTIYEWSHIRKLRYLLRSDDDIDLFDAVLDWVFDQEFATGFLVNNLEQMR